MIVGSGVLVWDRRVTGHRVCAACNFAGLDTVVLRGPNLEVHRNWFSIPINDCLTSSSISSSPSISS